MWHGVAARFERTTVMTEAPEQPPYFEGVVPFHWKPNRMYRVYVLPKELNFIYVGSGGETSAAVASQFGLVGALIAAAANPAQKIQHRQQQLDSTALEQLIVDHKHNFRAPAAELMDVSIDPRSTWLAVMFSQPKHVGVLRFTHAAQGKLRLCFNSVEDMSVAVECLPVALGHQVAVNVEWDEQEGKFVKKL
jgi:hypothetical protein